MDKKTTVANLKKMVDDFCLERNWLKHHTPKNLSAQIITEAGELLEHFRFVNEEKSKELLSNPAKKEEIADELSDVLYGVIRFSDLFDIDLSSALERKLKKLDEKYPALRVQNSTKKNKVNKRANLTKTKISKLTK